MMSASEWSMERDEDDVLRLLVRRTWIKKRRESWLSQDSDLKSGQDWLSQDFTLKSWIQASRLNFSEVDGSDFIWCIRTSQVARSEVNSDRWFERQRKRYLQLRDTTWQSVRIVGGGGEGRYGLRWWVRSTRHHPWMDERHTTNSWNSHITIKEVVQEWT